MKMGSSAKKSKKMRKSDSDLDDYNDDMSYKEVNVGANFCYFV